LAFKSPAQAADLDMTSDPTFAGLPSLHDDQQRSKNLTNDRELENQLRASAERYRGLAEQVLDGIFVANSEGRYLDANPAGCEMLGYTLDELRTLTIPEVLDPDELPKLPEQFERLASKQIIRNEWRLRRKDGSIFVGELVARQLPDGRLQGILRDITERKRAEEVRFRHAAIVESSSDAIISKNLNAVITSWNKGAERIFGYTEAEMVGQPIIILIPPELRHEEIEILEKLRTGGRIEHYETSRVTKTGDKVDVSLSISHIKDSDGMTVGFCTIAHDITRRKKAEAALRASEERLRLAQWAAHIGTFDLNLRTGVDIWTPETEALYGLPPGGFGGTLAAFENLVHPDDRERIIGLTREMIGTGQPAVGEWRVIWPDGSVHWIAARAQVFMDESGEPSRMLGVNIDITEHKRAEVALSGMTRKLIEAQEQERARIARELHDDITQRLVLLGIEIGMVQECSENPCEVRNRTQELSERAKKISNDIQALSHELHSSRLNYLGIAGGMKSWCNEFGERQGMKVEFESSELPNSLPREISVCLFRILQEALHNAAKHSGVKRIHVRLGQESDEIHLIVSDLGKGFDIATAMEGRGLGITSMRERVRLIDGTIAIDSKQPGGTTIHVRVPSRIDHGFQVASR
jgi:PAS domain S-box-containing protein